jgi:hypothetical protein
VKKEKNKEMMLCLSSFISIWLRIFSREYVTFVNIKKYETRKGERLNFG